MKTMPFQEVVEYHQRLTGRALSLPGSRWPRFAYSGDAGVLFVTRDRDAHSGLFGFNVRRQKVDGTIELAGMGNPYATQTLAFRHLRRMHEGCVAHEGRRRGLHATALALAYARAVEVGHG